MFHTNLFSTLISLLLTIPVLVAWPEVELLAAEASINTQQDLEQINQAIDRIELWLDTANNELPVYETRLAETEQQINSTSLAVDATRSAISQTQLEVDALNDRGDASNQARLEQVGLLKQSLRAAYMEGNQSYLKLLLNQEDPTKTARMLYYYQRFNLVRVEQINRYQATLDEIALIEEQLQSTRQALEQESQMLTTQLSELDQLRAARQLALTALSETINQQNSELDKLLGDREALEDLIEEINLAVENIPQPQEQIPFAQLKGSLPWPGTGELVEEFGTRFGNGELLRQGITIGAANGSPVAAVHGGRVVFADWLRGRGLLLIIDHGEGFMSLYGHNETLTRTSGSWVNAGDTIATAGNSGGQDQTGIYFEIRQNGRPQDPTQWFLPRS